MSVSDLITLAFSAFIRKRVINQILRYLSIPWGLPKRKSAIGMGMAVICYRYVFNCYLVLHKTVLAPYGLQYLRTIVFILVIAALVQVVEMFVRNSQHLFIKHWVFTVNYN